MIWRLVGLALVAAGVVFLVLGFQATDSVTDQVRQELTGEYSDRTIAYIIGGAVGVIVGGGLALFGGRLTKRPKEG